jgi:hypothetical protein
MKTLTVDPKDPRLEQARHSLLGASIALEHIREHEASIRELRMDWQAYSYQASAILADLAFGLRIGDVLDVDRAERWGGYHERRQFRMVVTRFEGGFVDEKGDVGMMPSIWGVRVPRKGAVGPRSHVERVWFEDAHQTLSVPQDAVIEGLENVFPGGVPEPVKGPRQARFVGTAKVMEPGHELTWMFSDPAT